MTDTPRITDEDLHAFIDGELNAARAADIGTTLQQDDVLTRRAAAFRADKERLVQFYGPLIDRPLPPEWLQMIERPRALQRSTPVQQAVMAIAASVLVMLGGFLVYGMLTPVGDETVIAAAVRTHNETVSTAPAALPADPGDTLTAALGLPLKAPDLSKMGYTLAAMQVLTDVPGGNAVKLAYRDAQNRLFTVYLTPSSGIARFDMMKRGDVRICVWQDDVLSTIMVGDMSAGEMLRLASLAYSGLSV